jgi:hypothetical protein
MAASVLWLVVYFFCVRLPVPVHNTIRLSLGNLSPQENYYYDQHSVTGKLWWSLAQWHSGFQAVTAQMCGDAHCKSVPVDPHSESEGINLTVDLCGLNHLWKWPMRLSGDSDLKTSIVPIINFKTVTDWAVSSSSWLKVSTFQWCSLCMHAGRCQVTIVSVSIFELFFFTLFDQLET